MASFTAGTTFVDGVANDVTAAKLGALITNATPTSGLIQDRTAETVVATNDTFLIGDASDSNTLKRMTVANVMKAELTGTINTTAGTITTLNSTTGTVATLNSTTGTITTGVIPTLTSITKITSGTGTAAAPAISPTGDTNTGIFFPAADTIAFSEGGAEAMRIDSGGQVGIGVTPSGWSASEYKAIQVGIGGSISGRVSGGDQDKVNVAANIYNDGTVFRYIASDDATIYQQSGGIHAFSNAPSGTAGNTITLTERLRIDSSGNVGIGTTSPGNLLELALARTDTVGSGALTLNGTQKYSFRCTASSPANGLAIDSFNGASWSTPFVIDNSGDVGIGTASPTSKLDVNGSFNATSGTIPNLVATTLITTGTGTAAAPAIVPTGDTNTGVFFPAADTIAFSEGGTEAMRLNSSGNVLIGKTTTVIATAGVLLDKTANEFTVSGSVVQSLNRTASDGTLVAFFQDGTLEGSISVAGTTVSYNGGHLSRWSQLLSGQRDASIKKGTVMSNLNEMCEWFDKDGNLLLNEQLNRVKVSDIEGENNVAGVFVNWDDDDKDNPFDLNMAMTGDMIIRIAQGTSVNRGDLLMSAGNGTAKPQGDDISRSKTIAKVTSTHVTCTYEDGSYCVPCVLMAC
jgi:hypothetical protein